MSSIKTFFAASCIALTGVAAQASTIGLDDASNDNGWKLFSGMPFWESSPEVETEVRRLIDQTTVDTTVPVVVEEVDEDVAEDSCIECQDDDLEVTPVPLPASSLLLIAGLGGLGAMRRMKRS